VREEEGLGAAQGEISQQRRIKHSSSGKKKCGKTTGALKFMEQGGEAGRASLRGAKQQWKGYD